MSFVNLLAGFSVSDGIMIAILVFLVLLMVLGTMRNRKFNSKLQDMRNDISVGARVMTDTGIAGEVVDISTEDEQKYLTLKSGTGKNVGFIKVHVNSIYYVFEDNKLNYAGRKEEDEFAVFADEPKAEPAVMAEPVEPVEPVEKPKKTVRKTSTTKSKPTQKAKKTTK